MVWPGQKDGRGENGKINCGLDTKGEKERGLARNMWMDGVQAAMTTRNGETEELRLVSGRQRHLLQEPSVDRKSDGNMLVINNM